MGKFKLGLKEQKVVCGKCGTSFENSPKRSFLGFLIFTCPNCAEETTYPLSGIYQAFYFLMATFFVLYSVNALAEGNFALPGFLAIASIFALVRNYSLKKKLKAHL